MTFFREQRSQYLIRIAGHDRTGSTCLTGKGRSDGSFHTVTIHVNGQRSMRTSPVSLCLVFVCGMLSRAVSLNTVRSYQYCGNGLSRTVSSVRCVPRIGSTSSTSTSTRTTTTASKHSNCDDNPHRDHPSDTTGHCKRYRLQGTTLPNNKSGVRVTTNTGHVLQTDLPRIMGGRDTAPQPIETLLAALMGCTQATAVFVARKMTPRVVLDRLELALTAERDERGALALPIETPPAIPARLQRVSGTVTLYAARQERLSTNELMLLREQTELRCPVANLLTASGCAMEVEWIDGNAKQA
jgi:putative redox protein